jgi:hypothetical protein
VGAVDRLEQTFAPGSESAELAAIKTELEDPERLDVLFLHHKTLMARCVQVSFQLGSSSGSAGKTPWQSRETRLEAPAAAAILV